MVRLQVNIYDSPNGTMVEMPAGRTNPFTEREVEIAEALIAKFIKQCESMKRGSASIIDKEIQPGA